MKTFLDLIEERGEARGEIRGEIKGEIKGTIKAIQTIALLRFQETSKRSTSLLKKLKKLNDLQLLNKTCQFASTAPTLLDVENFVESLIQVKPKTKRVLKKQAFTESRAQ